MRKVYHGTVLLPRSRIHSNMHGVVWLGVVVPIYVWLNDWTNYFALQVPHTHDIVYLYSPFAWILVHVIFYAVLVACVYSRPDWHVLCKRMAVGYALKAITQWATIVPQPMVNGGAEACRGAMWWELRGCADMMFSGHTMFTMLALYKYEWRATVVFTMAFELVLAKWHYIADCLMAVVVSCAVEAWIPLERINDERI